MNNAHLILLIKQSPEGDLKVIADGSGVPLSTLLKIRYDVTRYPRSDTLDRVREFIEKSALTLTNTEQK